MPQAFVSASQGGGFGAVSERSWSHTIAAGTNRVLFLNFGTGLGAFVGAVKYGGSGASGGTAMTAIGTGFNLGGGIHYAYYLVDPPVGTADIYIDNSDADDWVAGEAIDYAGGVAPDVAPVSNTAAANTTLTTSLTTVSDNAWTVLLAASEGGNLNAGTGSTLRQRNITTFFSAIFDSNGPKTPPGSTSMTFVDNLGDLHAWMVTLPLPGVGGGAPATTVFYRRRR